ncbi:MAG: acyl-CoA dehydrogenase family protein, partial [Solirubrobacteraceae bacterium]
MGNLTSASQVLDVADTANVSRSVLRALLVLAAFPLDGAYRALADIAKELGYNASTTHRYVSTWLAIGLLEQVAQVSPNQPVDERHGLAAAQRSKAAPQAARPPRLLAEQPHSSPAYMPHAQQTPSPAPSLNARSPVMSATADPIATTAASATADAALQAISGAAAQDVSFSLELSQDQKDIRDWVHGFAADVVRPAAHEWDEREQTPWPIIQEAAKIGLYGFEGMAQFFADPSGLGLPIVNEELFWGDAGIGMSIMGTALAVAAIFGQGSAVQIGEWVPRCFGTVDDVKVAAFCASEPNAGSDVSGVRTTAKFDEA